MLARWTRTTRCYLFPLACAVVCVFFVVETKVCAAHAGLPRRRPPPEANVSTRPQYKLLSQPPWVAGVFLLYSVLGVAQGSAYCSVYWLAGKEKSSTVVWLWRGDTRSTCGDSGAVLAVPSPLRTHKHPHACHRHPPTHALPTERPQPLLTRDAHIHTPQRELAIGLVAASGTAGSLLSFLFNYLLATYLWHG